MKRFLLPIVATLFLCVNSNAQDAGSIAFVAFNNDGPDDVIAFIILEEIPANVSIFLTDNNWNGANFLTNEGTIEWSSPTATPAGTVVTITGTSTTDVGSVAEIQGTYDFNDSNDGVYAYVGSSASPTFLAAVSNADFTGTPGVLSGTGLVEGETAVNVGDDVDVAAINVTIDCTGDDLIACASQFNDANNWITQDGAGDQGADGTSPDVPDDILTDHTIPNFGVLPVEFTSFTAINSRKGITLNWQTATEINNDRFVIQRSSDARRFETIGAVRGEGNSIILTEYSFIDESPATGINYYRLEQVDLDGAKSYSKIASATLDRSRVVIAPTATFDRVTVNTGTASSIAVSSTNGQIMNTQSDTEGSFTVDMSNFPQGIYYLTIYINGSVQTEKIVRL